MAILKSSMSGGRHSSSVSSAPTILRPHHLLFFQFVLLKLYRENKHKEAGIGPFFRKKHYVIYLDACITAVKVVSYWSLYLGEHISI